MTSEDLLMPKVRIGNSGLPSLLHDRRQSINGADGKPLVPILTFAHEQVPSEVHFLGSASSMHETNVHGTVDECFDGPS